LSAAPQPEDESLRLRSLHRLRVLDTPPEEQFDALVRAAALATGTPIALLTLLDADRSWLKATFGWPGTIESPRSLAFCAHAVLGSQVLEVEDATRDGRFADNPLVTGPPAIRYYAGAPLRLHDGACVGVLCVLDYAARRLSGAQLEVLRELSVSAVSALESRGSLLVLHEGANRLADSEARFRTLSDCSPVGIFQCDTNGRFIYTNDRWQQINGLTGAQALGTGWLQSVHPEDRELVYEEWMRAIGHGADYALEHRVLRGGDPAVHVNCRARAVRDANGLIDCYVGTVTDITARWQAEQALQQERRRLAFIIDGTQAGTFEWNVQSGELRLNERSIRMMGYDPATFQGITSEAAAAQMNPEDLARARDIMERHLNGECAAYECEVRVRHREGHWFWELQRGRVQTWTADGRPEWLCGIHLDITALKLQEEALRKSERFLQRSGEVAGVGAWEVDLRTQELVWSAVTCGIHGVPSGYRPTIAQAVQFYAPEVRPVIQGAVDRAIADGIDWDLELPLIRADGARVWVRATGAVERENGVAVRLVGGFQDVTEARRLRAELKEQHELLRVTLQSIGDAVITTDTRGRVAWLNPAAERITGWSDAQARGEQLVRVFRVLHEDTREPVEQPWADCLEHGTAVNRAEALVLVSHSGEEFGIEASSSPIRNEQGTVLGVALVLRDVTEQRRLAGELHYRATHDALTGLFNRSEFESRLRRALHKAQDDSSRHALLYIDIDRFKLVNDSCGHTVGDQMLQQVGRLLAGAVRVQDTLGRLGGDEFAVILEHCPAEDAQRVGEQICQTLDDFRFLHDGRSFRVGASIGLVPVDRRWESTAAILQAADSSCYAAKDAGRNRLHAWIDSDAVIALRRTEMQWAMRIEQALDAGGFTLYAQRIEALTAVEPGLHAEALLRMVDADGTLVLPGAFLPAAERFHLASRIDRWVMEHAIEWLRALPDVRVIDMLAVNLSGQSIGDRAFHRHAIDTLRAAGPEVCDRVCFEITETAAVTNMADASSFIEQLRSLRVRVALDDFGAGASSFGYLKHLAVDYLKIDGQFIRDLLDDPLDEAAVRCFAEVARVVGVGTVAEFVDGPEILGKVRALGIDFAQGFALHRPVPLRELLASSVPSLAATG
jgi:diguanylate cyclase (GGDEF)-like protein/PAS domain S-box-containing protein